MIAKKLIFEETAYLRENDLESESGFDEPSDIASAIRPVWEKWLDGNAISNALLHTRGEFFSM